MSIVSKNNCFHLASKRVSRKKRADGTLRARFHSAMYQMLGIGCCSLAIAAISVHIGQSNNFYDLASTLFASDQGVTDDWGPDNVVFRKRLTFDKFQNVFENRNIISFPSVLNDTARGEIWRLLIEEYANMTVPVGHAASQTLGDQRPLFEMKLRNYLNDHKFSKEKPHYVFDNQLLNRFVKVKDIILSHPQVLPMEGTGETRELFGDFDAPAILTVGTNGSGLAFHQHRRSWNDLYVGEKLWTVYSPFKIPPIGFNPWEPHLNWLEEVSGSLNVKLKPITFIQRAGEVVYIPEGWYHATMSLGVTVSVAKQPLDPIPNRPYFYMVKGDIALKNGDYKTALDFFKTGLELSAEKDFNLMRKVGEASEKNGLLRDAEKYYHRAIALNALHPAAYVELIGLLEEQGNIQKALMVLEVAMQRKVKHEVLDEFRYKLSREHDESEENDQEIVMKNTNTCANNNANSYAYVHNFDNLGNDL